MIVIFCFDIHFPSAPNQRESMSDPHPELEPKTRSQESLNLQERRGSETNALVDGEKTLALYEDSIERIWQQISPVLGVVTVVTIVERALRITEVRYPWLRYLEVSARGVSFTVVRQKLGEEDLFLLDEAFEELLANLLEIVGILTGDILVKQPEKN